MKRAALTALVMAAATGVILAGTYHLRVTNAPRESEYPSMAWTGGSSLGVCWMDGRDGNQEIYFKLVDMDQKTTGPARRLTNSNNWDYRPRLVWNGSGFGLLYVHERKVKRDLYFAHLNTKGGIDTGPIRLINQQMIEKDTRMAWTGSGYGLVYGDYRPGNLEIFYQAISERGQKRGPAVQLTRMQGRSEVADLVYTGRDFALAFLDERDGTRQVYFMLLDENGNVKTETRISRAASDCTLPSLAPGSGGFGLAWCQRSGSLVQVFFARVDADGNPAGEPRMITNDTAQKTWAVIAPLAQGFGVAYYAGDRLYRTLNYCSVDVGGNILQEAQALTSSRKAEAACPCISMIRGGQGLVIAWIDLGKDFNSEIYLTQVDFN